MHMVYRACLASLGTAFLLSMGAQAAELSDPEANQTAASVVDTDNTTPYNVVNDEQKTVTQAVAAVQPAPAIQKFAPTVDNIKLDGIAVKPVGYNINDENYFKLRDIAYIMNGKQASFSVDYDSATNSIILKSGEAYIPLGTEMQAGKANPKIQFSYARVLLDGNPITMTAYNIDGNNYFRLRDIGSHLGFEVDYVDKVVTLQSGPAAALKVTYDMGGHGEQIAEAAAVQGAKLTAPTTPTAPGYVFSGWYKDSEYTSAWDFASDKITEDTILYAKWIRSYTVSFDMNGQGTKISPKFVTEGGKLNAPSVPSSSGISFGGWYKDEECTEVWDFNADVVTEDITLYAKWSDTYTVNFHMNGMGNQISPKTNVASGSLISAPPVPTAAGYIFDGWYIDSTCTIPWSFQVDRVAQDVVLYARWVSSPTSGNVNMEEQTGSDNPQTPPTTTPDHTAAIDGQMVVLVDAGHGGTDPGEAGNGLDENTVNLAVAQYLQDMLQNAGVTVVMTRDDLTTTVRGQDRIDLVRALMQQYNFDVSISIHHNAAGTGSAGKAQGAEVYVQTVAQNPGGESRALGQWMIEEYQKLGQISRGVKTANLYMTRVPSEGAVPAILSEFCFFDNAADAAKVDTPEEQQAEAQAIFNAIMKYFDTYGY